MTNSPNPAEFRSYTIHWSTGGSSRIRLHYTETLAATSRDHAIRRFTRSRKFRNSSYDTRIDRVTVAA